jgi:hypothetical protein
MRDTYKPASEQTVRILSTDRELIATEMDLTRNTLDQIIAGNECDPFLKFKRMYAGCVRAGVDVSAWDASFHEIKTRNAVATECTPCHTLAEKIARDADTTSQMVEALRDGEIDQKERSKILLSIQKERDSLDVLEAVLTVTEPVTNVREWAKGAVNGRVKR